MSESGSDSYDDYSSEEETDETEETDQSEPSEKNKKQEPAAVPKKKESYSDDSEDSEENDTSTASEDQPEKPASKEEAKPKSNTEEKVASKKATPPKEESMDETESEQSTTSTVSTTDEQEKSEEKPKPKTEEKAAVTKAPPPKEESTDETESDDSEESESENSESSTPEKKPPPPPAKSAKPPPSNKPPPPPPSNKPPPPPAKKPSIIKEKKVTQSSSVYDYTESESEKPKAKTEPKKTEKSSTAKKEEESEDESTSYYSDEDEEEKKPVKKSKDSKSDKDVKKKSVAEPSQPAKKSTAANSTDLTQPPDFSVPPDVLEEANRQKVDRYGWIQTKEPSSKEKKLLEAELAKEEERTKKWKKMMSKKKWPYYQTRRGFRVVKERTIKGIPNDVRAKAWYLLLNGSDGNKNNRKTVQEYFDQGIPSVEHTIRVDIPRTMPNVPEFLKTETRQKLYRILRAYSNASGGGGYFQGMGFHAAVYLLYMKDEEKAFWCLYNLMMGDKHKVKDLFENEFSGLKVMNSVWEILLEKKFKHVYQKLKDLMVDPMIYTPSWFLCAFLDLDFPPVLRLRIIDRLIVFGSRQILSLALAVIDLNQETLSARNAQMDTVLPLLQNPTTAKTMKDWREIVKRWDKHYLSKKDYSALFKKAGLKEIP